MLSDVYDIYDTQTCKTNFFSKSDIAPKIDGLPEKYGYVEYNSKCSTTLQEHHIYHIHHIVIF